MFLEMKFILLDGKSWDFSRDKIQRVKISFDSDY